MTNEENVPSEWGSLALPEPLTSEQVEDRANRLLGQMTIAEKVGQMSGDAPLLSGTLDMVRAYNFHPIPAGETGRVQIPLAARQLAYYDPPRGNWAVDPQPYHVYVGSSARDADLLESTITVTP